MVSLKNIYSCGRAALSRVSKQEITKVVLLCTEIGEKYGSESICSAKEFSPFCLH